MRSGGGLGRAMLMMCCLIFFFAGIKTRVTGVNHKTRNGGRRATFDGTAWAKGER